MLVGVSSFKLRSEPPPTEVIASCAWYYYSRGTLTSIGWFAFLRGGNYSFVVWLVSSGPWVVWSGFFFRDLGFPFIFKSSSAEGSSSI